MGVSSAYAGLFSTGNAVDMLQRLLQNVLIKKYQRIERLILGGRRHVLVCRQPGQKLSDFCFGHVAGVAESMEAYEVSNPVPVGFFGAQAVMFGTNDCMQLIAQLGCRLGCLGHSNFLLLYG